MNTKDAYCPFCRSSQTFNPGMRITPERGYEDTWVCPNDGRSITNEQLTTAFTSLHLDPEFKEKGVSLPMEKPKVALKFDGEKPRMELLDMYALEQIAAVMTFGAKKYAAHNWRGGFQWSRLLGAAMRHLTAFIKGEDKDPESGLSHLAHLGCCVMFLLWHEKNKTELDDRYKG